MSKATIIYWRDIPTQIVLGRGRKALKHQLTNRFMVAVDKAAMKSDAADTDAYLAEWRKVPYQLGEGSTPISVEQLATDLEAAYPTSRLADLARNGGNEPSAE